MHAERFSEVRNPNTKISIQAKTHIGKNVVLGRSCENISIGYGCFLGNDLYIDVPSLSIGDYTTIHHGGVIHGLRTEIGHNCWIGHYTIIDSLGGNTVIGNNVGVGAHSQLWSHMKFGDTLNGCRWNSSGSLVLEDDVWLVGHCIVGPIHVGARAMLMSGGVAVHDMLSNHVYGGTPATDITGKLGPQFGEVSIEARQLEFNRLVGEFCSQAGCSESLFRSVSQFAEDNSYTQFNLENRKYRPVRSDIEFRFMKYMLYDKAKWLPA
jgi:acetyltransferase-like isoleucine patch superfamily enzyme